MRFFYSLLLYLLTPLLLLRLWYKGQKTPAYKKHIAQRFCCDSMQKQDFDIWLHAVSLGEAIAARPLIEGLLANNLRILITTMTPTGAAEIASRFAQKVVHRYVPYDLPAVLKRFFKYNRPKCGLIIETELWPNLIYQARANGFPLYLVNARLSENSFKGYRRLKFFFKPLLRQFTGIWAQSEEDAKRFLLLGAQDKNLEVLGNIKFDLQSLSINSPLFSTLKEKWGALRTVIIAASTHEGEERALLEAWPLLKAAIPQALLLIAPRHPERFEAVFSLSKAMGYATGLKSKIESLGPDKEVLILDSIGQLLGFYSLSDYAFVGGSLLPIGGHNVLEPIAMGVAVITGNYTSHFKSICDELYQNGALLKAHSAEIVFKQIIFLEKDNLKKQEQIKQASRIFNKNKGAVASILARVIPCC